MYGCLDNGYGGGCRRIDDDDRQGGRGSETEALKVASVRLLRCR